MKYYTFYREDNKFDDILNDINLKKVIDEKIRWSQHLVIGLQDDDKTSSYITLKYGDEMKNEVVKDFSPVPGVDYIPKKDASKFKKSIR
jgi:hypothetical protein